MVQQSETAGHDRFWRPARTRRFDHGQVQQESIREGRESDARKEAWNSEERKVRQEGYEPEAGDRHRIVGGSARRSEGPSQEVGRTMARPTDWDVLVVSGFEAVDEG